VDGFVQATWRIERDRRAATLAVRPFGALAEHDAVLAEGEELLAFLAADADERVVRVVALT
jgi:hypothetical protein